MHTHAHTHICVHTHTHIQPSQGIGIKEKVFKKRQAFKLKEYIKSWTDQGRTVEAFEMTIVIFWLMNDIYCK